MRHYEIVVLIHPDQSDQSSAMVERYKGIVEESGGPYIGLKTGDGVYSLIQSKKSTKLIII